MNGVSSSLTKRNRERAQTALLGVGVFALLVAVFLLSPWDGGDDWETFFGAARRLADPARPLYGERITHAYYSNPPWLAALLLPLAALPFRTGWAILAAGTLVAAVVLLRRWDARPGLTKPVLVLLSPAILYTVMHGQIDVVILLGVLLPVEWWGLVALTKPQIAVGLAVMVPRRLWLQAAAIIGVALLLSFVLAGFWIPDLLDQPRPFLEQGHNLWLGLWPFQVPAGVLLVTLGYARKDERLLIAGSPFLSPYAAMSSLAGPWIAAITFLDDWQALAVFASWWGAVILRAMGG